MKKVLLHVIFFKKWNLKTACDDDCTIKEYLKKTLKSGIKIKDNKIVALFNIRTDIGFCWLIVDDKNNLLRLNDLTPKNVTIIGIYLKPFYNMIIPNMSMNQIRMINDYIEDMYGFKLYEDVVEETIEIEPLKEEVIKEVIEPVIVEEKKEEKPKLKKEKKKDKNSKENKASNNSEKEEKNIKAKIEKLSKPKKESLKNTEETKKTEVEEKPKDKKLEVPTEKVENETKKPEGNVTINTGKNEKPVKVEEKPQETKVSIDEKESKKPKEVESPKDLKKVVLKEPKEKKEEKQKSKYVTPPKESEKKKKKTEDEKTKKKNVEKKEETIPKEIQITLNLSEKVSEDENQKVDSRIIVTVPKKEDVGEKLERKTLPYGQENVQKITFTVVSPTGQILYSKVVMNNMPMTVEELLKRTGLPIKNDSGFIESIAGIYNEGMSGWVYEVNGAPIMVSASDYVVSPEDQITWKYVSFAPIDLPLEEESEIGVDFYEEEPTSKKMR